MPTAGTDRPLEMVGGVLAWWTSRAEGDLGPRADGNVDARRRAVLDQPWSWVDQVHGARVITVLPGSPVAGPPADALVTPGPTGAAGDSQSRPAAGGGPTGTAEALAVFSADCATVALASPEGAFGAVHAGWKGLLAGVVEAAVTALRGLGASRVEAALGPCIHPGCYEFTGPELELLSERLGDGVKGHTAAGAAALDVPAAVAAAVRHSGAELVSDAGICTACSTRHWSYRARGDAARQALAVWRP